MVPGDDGTEDAWKGGVVGFYESEKKKTPGKKKQKECSTPA